LTHHFLEAPNGKPFLSLQQLSTKKPEPPKRPQEMRAKLGAKPFDACQHHWTKMDTIYVAPALQLHESASQEGKKSTVRGSNPLTPTEQSW
jgi:hypothetical protein